jgi:radical SAM-linked protein
MVGLPFETDADIAAIAELVKKAQALGARGRATINVSVGVFVPKPHTPFQWSAQLDIEESFAKFDHIKNNLPKGAQLKRNSPRTSYLEGVFARGDRRLSPLIEKAWLLGARLDGWSETFNFALWQRAADELAVDFNGYHKSRDLDEALPWQHLSAGVDEAFFKDELHKAASLIYTPDCREHGCQKCGLCDFKIVKPVTFPSSSYTVSVPRSRAKNAPDVNSAHKIYHYWVAYERLGKARFLGHLEMLQLLFRALRRAGLPLCFSQGYNPTPNVSFSPALSVGTQSHAEYFVAETYEPLKNLESCRELLNLEMPQGIQVKTVSLGSKNTPSRVETDYLVTTPVDLDPDKAAALIGADEFFIAVVRKHKQRQINVRPDITTLRLENAQLLFMTLQTEISKAAVKPMELVSKVFDLSDEDLFKSRLTKLAYRVL